jgi:hypothetical protein
MSLSAQKTVANAKISSFLSIVRCGWLQTPVSHNRFTSVCSVATVYQVSDHMLIKYRPNKQFVA